MFRRTSKIVQEQVDKMRLPAVVHLCKLWIHKVAPQMKQMQRLQIVMKELPLMTVWCRITTLKLHDLCDSKFAGQTVRNNFARVLQAVVRQSAGTLTWLGLTYNDMGWHGTRNLARVLPVCTALTELNLAANQIGDAGAGRLAGVLAQCAALAHLDVSCNQIGPGGAQRLAGVLAQCTELTHLNLSGNDIGDSGAESIAAVLGKCPALKLLDVEYNNIGSVAINRLVASSTGTLHFWVGDNLDDEEEDEEEEEEEDTSDFDREEEDEEEAEEELHSD